MIDHEGFDMARWLVARGVTAFVLKYRVARTPDTDDGLITFRTELQTKLGRAGPTDTAPPSRELTRDVRLLGEEDCRQAIRFVREHAADWDVDPNRIGICGFSAGGGVAMGPVFEHDAHKRLLPPPRSTPPTAQVSRSPTMPRRSFSISDDDMSIPPISTARLYEAWHKAGKPAELHIFGNGAHGFGMETSGKLPDPWIDLFGNWLKAQGISSRSEVTSFGVHSGLYSETYYFSKILILRRW